jgi:prolyl 4-hydroxylase
MQGHRAWLLVGVATLGFFLLLKPARSTKETFMSKDPCTRPVLISAFLSPSECAAIVRAAQKAGFQRSEVDDEKNPISKVRTSDQVTLPLKHPAVAPIVKYVESMTGKNKKFFEDLQVVRYRPGQKYEGHYDTDDNTPEENVRTDTVLMYLNDDFEGGQTRFTTAGTTVTPQRGLAVWWKNVDAKGGILPCGKHEALPVKSGMKYACTIWVCRSPQK